MSILSYLRMCAEVWCLAVHPSPEECPARVAGDGPVVHVVIGNVPANLASHLSDVFWPFPFGLALKMIDQVNDFYMDNLNMRVN